MQLGHSYLQLACEATVSFLLVLMTQLVPNQSSAFMQTGAASCKYFFQAMLRDRHFWR